MKKRIAAAALAVAAVAGGIALRPREGCGAVCCARPEGAPAEACMRRHPRTGEVQEFGAAIPATHAVGSGCVAVECLQGLGIEWLDGGAL